MIRIKIKMKKFVFILFCLFSISIYSFCGTFIGIGRDYTNLDIINVKDYGATGTDREDDSAAFTDAVAYAAFRGGEETLYIPKGKYKISSDVTIPSTITVQMAAGAILDIDSGKTFTVNGTLEKNSTDYVTGSGTLVVNLIQGLGSVSSSPNQWSPPYMLENVVSNFQTSHGFVEGGTGGSQEDDTTNYIKGNQCLKLTTDGSANAKFTTLGPISPAIDFTGKYPKLWVYVSDTTKIAELWIYASTESDLSKRYTWKLEDDITQLKSETWCPVTLSFGEATVTSTPDRTDIDYLRLRVTDKGTGAVSVSFGAWSLVDEPLKGMVSLVFDDGWSSQFSQARLKMDQYGFAGTCYIIPDYIGTSNYMTLAQLKYLQNQLGWDISAHYQTDLTSLTGPEVEMKLISVKNYLLNNGFSRGANDFAYPNGKYDETTVLPLVRKYFRSARTIAAFAETFPPADYHKLRVLLVINTTSTASIATAIDQARTNKEWLILIFHKIVTTASAETEYSISNFGTVIDDIASDGILVKRVSDVLNLNSNKTQALTRNIIANIMAAKTLYNAGMTNYCIDPKISNSMTISNIEVTHDANPSTELDADLYFADAFIGKANAVLINTLDTTNGALSDSSITHGRVPKDKALYIYFKNLDATNDDISVNLTVTDEGGES